MKVVYIKPTDTCNLDCDHCFTSGSKGAKTVWDIDKVAQWASELGQRFPEEHLHLELHGGEPFLRPIDEHWQFANAVRSRVSVERWEDISIGATTNLIYKLTDRHVEFFKTMMSSHVGTSWDPVYRFKTERMYTQWRNNLTMLRAQGITIKMFVTVTDQLLTYDIDELIHLWGEFGVTEIAVERLTSDGNAVDNPTCFQTIERWIGFTTTCTLRTSD